MKTTIDLPDPILHRAKMVAAQRRTTLKELIIAGLESVMTPTSPRDPIQLSAEESQWIEIDPLGVPVLKQRQGALVTDEAINRMRNDLGI